MRKKIILVGAFHEIIELCEEENYNIIGIIENKIKDSYYGYKIIGTDDDADQIIHRYANIPLVITPDSPEIREKLYNYYSKLGFKFETIISSKAKISKSAKIGLGTIVQAGVNISTNTIIEKFVKLNTFCNVMHDCKIEDFTTIAPNAVVLGRVYISKKSYIGANSTILPEIMIAENCKVGAGAVVVKNILEKNSIYAGVPAKKIEKAFK